MEKPVYVIVHGAAILEFKHVASGILLEKINELERILREEEKFEINDDSILSVPKGLPKGKEVRVCGGLRGICVANQLHQLLEADYDASIYDPATLP